MVSIDGVVAGNSKDALTVSHHDVFTLLQNAETGLLQSTHCV